MVLSLLLSFFIHFFLNTITIIPFVCLQVNPEDATIAAETSTDLAKQDINHMTATR